MKVNLVSQTNYNPEKLISFAGRVCYSSSESLEKELGKAKLDIKKSLWRTGHHTTFQHFFLTFLIQDIAVGDITFGLHLVHPFYNSSQRSGRYASKIFWQDNVFEKIKEYISLWELNLLTEKEIFNYISEGTKLFRENHKKAAKKVAKILREERPYLKKDALKIWAPKIAQEQLRVFIPVIFPTAILYTINLSTLASLYRIAWSSSLKKVVELMKVETLKKFPELEFLFEEKNNWFSKEWLEKNIIASPIETGLRFSPSLEIVSLGIVNPEKIAEIVSFWQRNQNPLNLLPFLPEAMENNFNTVSVEVETSLITLSQDQRHRTIKRSLPVFSGNFYVPPLLRELELEKEAVALFKKWFSLKEKIPWDLWIILAPYGSMVKYRKLEDLNALVHEQQKRLCLRAQEEIRTLAQLFRKQAIAVIPELKQILIPPCLISKCPEGERFCGRDVRDKKNFLTQRQKV